MPPHKYVDSLSFKKKWDHANVVGMLLHLSDNSRPDIACTVNQCARFTQYFKNSHRKGIKKTLRYLKGSQTKGMIICPTDHYTVYCYAEANFGGFWGSEDEQKSLIIKTRTGFVILFMACSLPWSSKFQTSIVLVTMKAEYVALSHSISKSIGRRQILKDIHEHVFDDAICRPGYSTKHKYVTP